MNTKTNTNLPRLKNITMWDRIHMHERDTILNRWENCSKEQKAVHKLQESDLYKSYKKLDKEVKNI